MVLVLVLLSIHSGCTDNEEPNIVIEDPPLEEDKVHTTMFVHTGDEAEIDINWSLANATADFGFELYKEISKEGENLLISPWSIMAALGMIYEGTRGETAHEMQKVLHLTTNDTQRHDSFQKLLRDINDPDLECKLSSPNGYFVDEDYPLNEEYMDLLEEVFRTEANELDILADPDGSREFINQWAFDRTNGKIADLIPKDQDMTEVVLVLANALYFNAAWEHPFDPEHTEKGEFETSDGTFVEVDMMCNVGGRLRLDYYAPNHYSVIELPYTEDDVSMLIILPDGNSLAYVESLMEDDFHETLDHIRSNMYSRTVNVKLPRFKIEDDYELAQPLTDIGMTTVFKRADLSGIGPGLERISFVYHKTYISVNETGTEAAAATTGAASIGVNPQFYADHPFLFMIQQKSTGNILFMGKVEDPTA